MQGRKGSRVGGSADGAYRRRKSVSRNIRHSPRTPIRRPADPPTRLSRCLAARGQFRLDFSSVNFATLSGLAVLNPGGQDPDQSFKDGPGLPDETVHPPINYHAYAACTLGAFYRRPAFAARHRSVLLLLRGDLIESQRAFAILKAHGCFVAVSFKESGTQQVARQLSKPKRYQRFREIASSADLCLSSTPDLLPLFASVSKRTVHIPTPYPFEYASWNFSRPISERRGLFYWNTGIRSPFPQSSISLIGGAKLFRSNYGDQSGRQIGSAAVAGPEIPGGSTHGGGTLTIPEVHAVDCRPSTGAAIRPELRPRTGCGRQSALPDPDGWRKRYGGTIGVSGAPRERANVRSTRRAGPDVF